jgi:hypothetical protein
MVDSDLNLWVDRPSKRTGQQSGRSYTVFDRTGRMLGDVVMPTMRVQQIHEDVVIGIVTDGDGVQSIVVHRLRKPIRGGSGR